MTRDTAPIRHITRIQEWVAVGSLLLLSILLRLYQLNAGLWHDEILTYVLYVHDPLIQIITTYDSENQHLLYSILAHISLVLFGDSNWALRLPAVLFGVASLGVLYLLGRELTSRREAFLATALLTVSYHHIWFSQNARGYTGMLFWTLLSSLFLVRGLQESRRRTWLLYAGSAALGVYTHMTMLFVIAGQFAVYVVALWARRRQTWPNRWSGFVFGFVGAGVLTLVLYAPVVPQILTTVGGTEASVVAEWKNPLWTVLEILRGVRLGFAGGIMAIGALVLFGAGMVSYTRTRPILVGLFLIPPIIGAGAVIAVGHHLWPRFFFFAAGFAMLIVIRGATYTAQLAGTFVRMPASRTLQLGTAVCILMIVASTLSVPFAYGPKQDFDGARRFVEDNVQPGDAVVTVDLASFTYTRFYDTTWEPIVSLQALNSVRMHANRTWLIYTFPPVLESVHPDIMEDIRREFTVVKQFDGTVARGAIIVCRADGPPAVQAAESAIIDQD